jgi:hypothetical protein
VASAAATRSIGTSVAGVEETLARPHTAWACTPTLTAPVYSQIVAIYQLATPTYGFPTWVVKLFNKRRLQYVCTSVPGDIATFCELRHSRRDGGALLGSNASESEVRAALAALPAAEWTQTIVT